MPTISARRCLTFYSLPNLTLEIIPSPAMHSGEPTRPFGQDTLPIAIRPNKNQPLPGFLSDFDLFRNAYCSIRVLAAKDKDDIYIIHSSTDLFLPISCQVLFDRGVDEIKRTVWKLCLASKHMLRTTVVVIIKTNKYSFPWHLIPQTFLVDFSGPSRHVIYGKIR